MTVDTERMRRNLELTGGLIMAEAVATALVAPIGRAAADAAVARACNRSIAEGVPLATVLRIDPALRPHLTDAEMIALPIQTRTLDRPALSSIESSRGLPRSASGAAGIRRLQWKRFTARSSFSRRPRRQSAAAARIAEGA